MLLIAWLLIACGALSKDPGSMKGATAPFTLFYNLLKQHLVP